MSFRFELALKSQHRDSRGAAVARRLAELLPCPSLRVLTREVFLMDARLAPAEAQRVLDDIVHPVLQDGRLGQTPSDCDWLLIIGFKPGVTDNVARTLREATGDILGRPLSAEEAVAGTIEYLLFNAASATREQVTAAAWEALANPLIQSLRVFSRADLAQAPIPPHLPRIQAAAEGTVELIKLEIPDAELQRLSDERTLALSLEELQAIQRYYREHGNDPARQAAGLGPAATDVELEVLAQTWSEHCKHKIFAADIEYTDEHGQRTLIHGLYPTYIKRSTREIGKQVDWLRSVFTDNAGVIAFNDQYDLAYKVETHNSPSALDPYGGAMTGIVGVNRDPLGTGMGAALLVNVWGYCFAPPNTPAAEIPAGLLHPRRIRDGVHQGVIEGGNQSGIPYGLGWEYFDPRYLGKPLVFCGTVGLLPRQLRGQPGHAKSILPGDLIVMAGGRIGKDGIHGATFSSEELHGASPAQAVQIGDPITQKKLADFTLEARDLGLYRFITDNGAGGLSSSIGEMASNCGGCRLDLAKAPLKYAGLVPWEILLSEAQERMSYAVIPEKLPEFLALAARREVEVAVLGEFTATGMFHIQYGERTVAFLDMALMHDGCPKLRLPAQWTPPRHSEPALPPEPDLATLTLNLLGRYNLCSGESKARQYDHEVKGLSVSKPYLGVRGDVPADATIFQVAPLATDGIVLSAAVLPRYSDIDTWHMTAAVIELAVRRAVAVGADPERLAGLDNFCWPDPVLSAKTPDGPYKLAQLVRANQALYETTLAFRVPCISGKDSMKNDSTRGGRKISIPPTLLFSVIGRIPELSKAVNLACKRANDLVFVLGTTRRELGGSEFYASLGHTGNRVPTVDSALALRLNQAVARAIKLELCRSVHAPAVGGLGIGFVKIAMGGRLGLDLNLHLIPRTEDMTLAELLFSESTSRYIVTLPSSHRTSFEALLAGLPYACVGKVKVEPVLTYYCGKAMEAEIELSDAVQAFQAPLNAD